MPCNSNPMLAICKQYAMYEQLQNIQQVNDWHCIDSFPFYYV